MQNNSAFNVELRCNSPEGEVLGYVGAYTANTVLNVQPADYTFYPVFKKYIAWDNEIYSIVPKFISSGKPYARDITIENEETWNVGEVWDSTAMQLSSGGFYLTIINNAETAVRFKKGTQEFESSLGFKGINSGKQVTFFVPFERQKDPQGGYLGYPEEVELAVLSIGSALFPNKLPKYTYKLDTKYTISIEGAQQDNLTLSEIKEVGKVNINKLFGL